MTSCVVWHDLNQFLHHPAILQTGFKFIQRVTAAGVEISQVKLPRQLSKRSALLLQAKRNRPSHFWLICYSVAVGNGMVNSTENRKQYGTGRAAAFLILASAWLVESSFSWAESWTHNRHFSVSDPRGVRDWLKAIMFQTGPEPQSKVERITGTSAGVILLSIFIRLDFQWLI